MGSLMFIYQDVLSPQISAECPYEISCSNFGKAVIKRYGLIKGIALTAGRLMRCNKIGSVDIHPLYIDAKGKIIDDPEQYRLK
jgi:putative component of membrane protein insertase Oxa1/YidC/SpoIIIJ protein YidD